MTVADNRGRVHGRLGRWKFVREASGCDVVERREEWEARGVVGGGGRDRGRESKGLKPSRDRRGARVYRACMYVHATA